MKNNLKILLVGFYFETTKDLDVTLLYYQDIIDQKLNSREITFLSKKLLDNIDFIFINTNKRTYGIAENILLQFAYTKDTPIFGVGEGELNRFLVDVVLRVLPSVDEAIDHIKAHYSNIV